MTYSCFSRALFLTNTHPLLCDTLLSEFSIILKPSSTNSIYTCYIGPSIIQPHCYSPRRLDNRGYTVVHGTLILHHVNRE